MIPYRSVVALALLVSLVHLAPLRIAFAHSNEHLATVTGAHGGMLRMSGPYHVELVIGEGEVRVWVTDHADNPKPTAGARGQLMVIQDEERFVVDLLPDGDNLLHGANERITAGNDRRAVLTLRMKGQAPLQVRFITMSEDRAASQQGAHAEH